MALKPAVCVVVLVLFGTGTAQAIDKDKLRAAARPPHLPFELNLGCKDCQFFIKNDKKADPEAEITTLQKTLMGDDDDAPRFVRLGDLYTRESKVAEAKQCFEKAAALFRQRLEREPHDARLLAEYGDTLCCLGKHEEGEALLLRAFALAPKDWKCQIARCNLLLCKANRLFFKQFDQKQSSDPNPLKAASTDFIPGPEAITLAKKCLKEARDGLERMVVLTPDDPEVYRRRFQVRVDLCFSQSLIMAVRKRPLKTMPNSLLTLCAAEARADLYQLTRLCPNDYLALGFMAQAEIQAHALKNPDMNADGMSLTKGMASEGRQRLQAAKDQLRRLSQSKEREVAARSGLILGWLQTLSGESEVAVQTLRRVIVLDPTQDDAWSILIGTLNLKEQYKEAAAVCTEQLKHADTAKNRFALARIYYASSKIDGKAEEQLRLALERDGKNVDALIGLAGVLLRRATDEATLTEVGQCLSRAEPLLGKEHSLRPVWNLNQGIYLALNGNVTQARFCLLNILVVEPRDEEAKQALMALSD